MSNDFNPINLGNKNNLEAIQKHINNDGGVQKGAFGEDKMMQSIFDKLDTNKDGILDRNELAKFSEGLETAAQLNAGSSKNLGKMEAKEFLQELTGERVRGARGVIEKFLNVIGSSADNVEATQVRQTDKGVETTVLSTDGSMEKIETFTSQGRVYRIHSGEDGIATLEEELKYDINGKVTERTQTEFTENGSTKTIETLNKKGNVVKSETRIYNETGQVKHEEVEKFNRKGETTKRYEVSYDENGQKTFEAKERHTWFYDKQQEISYHGNGEVKSKISYFKDRVYDVSRTREAEYAENGQKTSSNFNLQDEIFGINIQRDVKYDENGRRIREDHEQA
jgi:hypothetical protein